MQHMVYPGAETSVVHYGHRGDGFLAIPENASGTYGAVILGHERYGLVKHTLDLAIKFAAHGYVTLAPVTIAGLPDLWSAIE